MALSTNRQLGKRQQSVFEDDVVAALLAQGVPLERHVHLSRWNFDGRITGTFLLLECDGSFWHHLPDRVERDARKDAWAAGQGFTVLRVTENAWQTDPVAAIAPVLTAWQATGSILTPAPPVPIPPAIPPPLQEPPAAGALRTLTFHARLPEMGAVIRTRRKQRVWLTLEVPEIDKLAALKLPLLEALPLCVTLRVEHGATGPLPEALSFSARLPDAENNVRIMGDGPVRFTLEVPAHDRPTALAVAALTNCSLLVTLEVCDADPAVAEPSQPDRRAPRWIAWNERI